jgi:hypothetical protein
LAVPCGAQSGALRDRAALLQSQNNRKWGGTDFPSASCGVRKLDRLSSSHAVFVNQASESVPSVDLTGLLWSRRPQEWCRLWRDEAKASMRPMAVVVLDIGTQRTLELAATEDQHPVEALAPHGADEALGEGVCLRGLHRCADNRDPLSSKDLIERSGELAVAVVDQEP